MTRTVLKLKALKKTIRTPFSRRPGFTVGPLDLEISESEIVGLLGANGAGKTSSIKMILGLLVPEKGDVEILGGSVSAGAWREKLGYLPEQPAFYDYLSGIEFLRMTGGLFGFSSAETNTRADRLLDRVELGDSRRRPIRTYSKGMLQRLGLAQALLNDPQLLILDEPMSGLDPLGRRFVRDLMVELRAEGRSILFSTHIIPDAEFVCDRVALMRGGSITAVGTFDELLGVPAEFEIACARGSRPATLDDRERRINVRVSRDRLSATLDELMAQGSQIISVSPIRASVEDLLAPNAQGR